MWSWSVGGIAGDAADEAAGVEGEEEVSVVDIMQGEHGAAVEQIARGQGLEAEVFEGDSEGRTRAGGEEWSTGKDEN